MDFLPELPGHLHLLGALAATSHQGAGFNVIEISDRYNGTAICINARPESEPLGHPTWQQQRVNLVFENERTGDALTVATRNEFRHCRYREFEQSEGVWESQFRAGAAGLLMVGPHSRRLALSSRQQRLLEVLRSNRTCTLRILIADPGLYHIVESIQDAEGRERLRNMWGTQHTWADQSLEAQHAIEGVRKLARELQREGMAERLKVRL